MSGLSDRARHHLETGEPAIWVTLAETAGSTPRETGASMVVTEDDATGTIGGGRLEFESIAAARQMLASGEADRSLDLPLGPAIGQCCGGRVRVRLVRVDREALARIEALDNDEMEARPAVYLFGAGHVGKAIAAALAPLPFCLLWIDSRADEFPPTLPDGVRALVTADPVSRLVTAPAGTGVLVLTHSHPLDFALAEVALGRGDLAYAGMIGSTTKRSRFERWYLARGGNAASLKRLTCPIGAGLRRDKRPAVIAAMVAAELLMALDAGAARSISEHRRWA